MQEKANSQTDKLTFDLRYPPYKLANINSLIKPVINTMTMMIMMMITIQINNNDNNKSDVFIVYSHTFVNKFQYIQ